MLNARVAESCRIDYAPAVDADRVRRRRPHLHISLTALYYMLRRETSILAPADAARLVAILCRIAFNNTDSNTALADHQAELFERLTAIYDPQND